MEFHESIQEELKELSPEIFDNKTRDVYYDKLLSRTKVELKIILGEDLKKNYDVLNQWFIDQIKPKKLYGIDSFENTYDKEYEESCCLLSKYTNKDPKQLTVKEFYIIIISLNKQ